MNIDKYKGRDNKDKDWFLMEYTEVKMISFYERKPNFITSSIFLEKVIDDVFYIYHFNKRINVAYSNNLLDDVEYEEMKIVRIENKIMFIGSSNWIEFIKQ